MAQLSRGEKTTWRPTHAGRRGQTPSSPSARLCSARGGALANTQTRPGTRPSLWRHSDSDSPRGTVRLRGWQRGGQADSPWGCASCPSSHPRMEASCSHFARRQTNRILFSRNFAALLARPVLGPEMQTNGTLLFVDPRDVRGPAGWDTRHTRPQSRREGLTRGRRTGSGSPDIGG